MTVTLRNIHVVLVSLLSTWKDFTPFLSISFLNFGNCCRLGLPAEIKVETSKNYETCKERCKLCHINQTGQTRRRKETCIKFINPLNASVDPHIETSQLICTANQLTGFYMRATLACNGLSMQSPGFEQTFMKFIDSSDMWSLELYLINTFTKSTKGREMYRHYARADTLFCLLLLKI